MAISQPQSTWRACQTVAVLPGTESDLRGLIFHRLARQPVSPVTGLSDIHAFAITVSCKSHKAGACPTEIAPGSNWSPFHAVQSASDLSVKNPSAVTTGGVADETSILQSRVSLACLTTASADRNAPSGEGSPDKSSKRCHHGKSSQTS
ncbi:hypothetical protein J3458_020496 [Metarhizium acridum]|uniref:uncharacterized protein n=1 Tax=Metarhizium acridum TaxID=92637 RepID=UPI001C6C0B9D|nr:hypothetical protein J3458_020496 [Metarhizium acridum]